MEGKRIRYGDRLKMIRSQRCARLAGPVSAPTTDATLAIENKQ